METKSKKTSTESFVKDIRRKTRRLFISEQKILIAMEAIRGKRKLIGSTFPENLIFSKKNSRTASLNKAILLIMSVDNGFRKQKAGELFKNVTITGTVESIGVEPTTSCMPCKRSSQLS